KIRKAIHNIYRGQKGITGLETAIILIAFVTVAAVLAYTVLSSGIFSSEQGKAAVYSGLESAQSTMAVKGSVVGTGTENQAGTAIDLTSVQFNLGLAITGTSVDLSQCTFNYWDASTATTALPYSATLVVGTGGWKYSNPQGTGSILSGTNQAVIEVMLPNGDVTSYSTFTIQINPPTGASITIQRAVGSIAAAQIVDLN